MTRELTKDEYLATFAEPMRRLEAGESFKPVRLTEYVSEVVAGFDPPVTLAGLQIQHVYLNGDQTFYHVVIHFGRPNVSLVVVVDCHREAVHGHHLLDLHREYGLGE